MNTKKLKFFAVASVFVFGCTLFANTAQAQTKRPMGPVRTTTFTVTPPEGKNGYEVKITLKYRFEKCVDVISLDGYRTKHEPLAYWYNGKRYTEAEIKGGCKFKTDKSDVYPNLDFSADIILDHLKTLYAKGEWFWVNLSDWGGCLGDYSGKYGSYESKMKNKDYIAFLQLTNIKPKDAPRTDSEIEKYISGKEEPKKEEKPAFDCVDINGVCWATKNLGGDDALWSHEEAIKNCPVGWRLPTKSEFELLIASGRNRNNDNGAEHFAGGKLILPAAGYNGTGEQFKNVYAYYWTGTTANNGAYCYLGVYGNCNEIRGGDLKFSVRLVKK